VCALVCKIKKNVRPISGFILCLPISVVFSTIEKHSFAAANTPSTALPEVYQRPETKNLNKFDNRDLPPPNIQGFKPIQQKDEGLKIIAKTLIILAPDELQNKISFLKYQEQVIGVPKTINDFYNVAAKITSEFNKNGFPLVRVIVPKQELDPESATVFLKVIDGFIEKVDLRKVPVMQTLRTYSYLKPLIKKKALTKDFLERKLILAGNTVGLTLKSGLMQGKKEGGAVLVIEANHKILSGSMQFNNSQSKELGTQLGQTSLTLNSPAGFGESITLFGLSRPTWKGMKGTGDDVRIRGGGFTISVPVSNNGLSTSVAYTESMTRPGVDLQALGIEANMKSASLMMSYPISLKEDKVWTVRGTINWADEIQQTNLSGVDEDLTHDRLTSLRVGTNYSGCKTGCLTFDAEISRGLEIASRSASDSAGGTPLSRTSGTSTYTHMKVDSSYLFNLYENIQTKINAGGQYTDDGLLNSEQTSIIAEDRVSSLTSGAISGDKAWYIRGEIAHHNQLSKGLSFSPYVYSAMGVAYLNKATEAENKQTTAKSVGIGLNFNGNDEYFFEKNISAKVEYSKTWGTGRIEDLSDVRLNKQQMLVTMAMTF